MKIPKGVNQSMNLDQIRKISELSINNEKNDEDFSFASEDLKLNISVDETTAQEKIEIPENSNSLGGDNLSNYNSHFAQQYLAEQEVQENLRKKFDLIEENQECVFCKPIRNANKKNGNKFYLMISGVAIILGIIFVVKNKFGKTVK